MICDICDVCVRCRRIQEDFFISQIVISELVAVSEDQLIADLKELLTKHSSHRDKFAADEDIMSFLWQEESNGERGRPSMKTVVENLQLKAECCTPHVYK